MKKKIGYGEKKNRWGWVIIAAFTARTARDAKNKKKWEKRYRKCDNIFDKYDKISINIFLNWI